MTRYPHTIATFRRIIAQQYPELRPREYENNRMLSYSELAAHLLWMCAVVEGTSDLEKAARWIGWMLAMAEERLRLWDNAFSRSLIRQDVYPDLWAAEQAGE